MPTLRLLIPSVTLCALAAALAATGVRAQTDLDAGKSGPQLFAQDCAACHRSPHGLLKNISSFGLVGFLRQHYTSSSASANTVAAYLQAVANARPPDQKKGKGSDQQQAKQSPPTQARTAPATEAPPAQAARPGEPATEQNERPGRRPPRRQAPAEAVPMPPPEPATAAARPAEPAPPEPPPEPAKEAAAAPVEPGFTEPLP